MGLLDLIEQHDLKRLGTDGIHFVRGLPIAFRTPMSI